MNTRRWWEIIDAARAESQGKSQAQLEVIRGVMARLDISSIIEFQEFVATERARLFQPSLWMLAFICSSQFQRFNFSTFLDWLILQGWEVTSRSFSERYKIATACERADELSERLSADEINGANGFWKMVLAAKANHTEDFPEIELPDAELKLRQDENQEFSNAVLLASTIAKNVFEKALLRFWPSEKWVRRNIPFDRSEIMRALAEQDNPAGHYEFANYCLVGTKDISADVAKALAHYHRAADCGVIAAQYALGRIFQDGESVTPDFPKAIHWLERAAANGHLDAANDLGAMFEKGGGVAIDLSVRNNFTSRRRADDTS